MIDDPPASDVVDKSPEIETPNEAPTEAMAAWTEALHSVERSINEASEAIRFLRATILEMAPLLRSVGGLEEALRDFGEQPHPRPVPPLEFEEGESRPDPGVSKAPHRDAGRVERDWPLQRPKAAARERAPQWVEEAESPWTPPAGPPRPAIKPVTLVPDDTPAPYGYRVTIEDRKGPVELMQLHRALTGIESVRNVSLLNYVNGVASLSIEATDEVQPQELENAVKKTMKRSCSVVPHESNVILIQVGE